MDLIATSVRHYIRSGTLNVTALLTDARRPQGGAGPCRRLLGERQSEESYLFPRASLTWKLSCCVIWFGFSKKKISKQSVLDPFDKGVFITDMEQLAAIWDFKSSSYNNKQKEKTMHGRHCARKVLKASMKFHYIDWLMVRGTAATKVSTAHGPAACHWLSSI